MTSSKAVESVVEVVLFSSDTLSRIITYLPSVDVLNLALTCTRFSVSKCILSTTVTIEQSLIEKSTHIAVQDLASDEELAALPHYEGESTLADYHYLQLSREPLSFDQLVGGAEYVNNDKSCVRHSEKGEIHWETALSNNILRAGKHYATFNIHSSDPDYNVSTFLGVMIPGHANQNADGLPTFNTFYQHVSRLGGERNKYNSNSIQCCMYNTSLGYCHFSPDNKIMETWEGSERMSSGDEIGMLLDLDVGTLTVYKNGRKLGIMKRGLAGPYCWVVSMRIGIRVSIKRGTVPS